jgi:parallel beta-helix repeat protein
MLSSPKRPIDPNRSYTENYKWTCEYNQLAETRQEERKTRIVSGIMLAILIGGFMAFAINVRQAESKPGTIIVPDDYPTIQDAIGNATAGDTIFVRAGTYCEHLEIDKPLTLEGESNQNTTIKLFSTPTSFLVGIDVSASNVKIEGFYLTPVLPRLSVTSGPEWRSSPTFIWLDGRTTNCTNITIENNVLDGRGSAMDCLDMLEASNNRIVNNTMEHNHNSLEGSCIYMYYSDSNVISYNDLSGGWAGIEMLWCSNNTILANDITNTTVLGPDMGGGIQLMHSSDNVVVGNTLTGNDVGIDVWGMDADGNSIYHNNFVGNTIQASEGQGFGPPSINIWDKGYPGGGNYWSDYAGVDLFSGPYQNVTGSDGIGDTPYVINANNTDRYPLMRPVQKIVGDVNMDGKVDGKDISEVALAFGTRPGDPRWNPLADLDGDGKIDGRDMTIVASHFGESYW